MKEEEYSDEVREKGGNGGPVNVCGLIELYAKPYSGHQAAQDAMFFLFFLTQSK